MKTWPAHLPRPVDWKTPTEWKIINITTCPLFSAPDFYDRILLEGEPSKVVWIRTGNMRREQFEAMISNVWKNVEEYLCNHALIEVYENCIEGIKKP